MNTLDDWLTNRLTTLLSISSNDEVDLVHKIIREEIARDEQEKRGSQEDTLVKKD